jgi:amino acid transporter
MSVDTSNASATESGGGKSNVALARDIGLIGLLWASVGSIIGSGWLFGAQRGLLHAGPAAIVSWVIGGFCILLLALVHAELGAMYPLSGGSARFPHYAYGGYAGASFGWFSYVQAVTVAPIEVSATILYLTHYHFAHTWLKADGTLTHTGLVVAILLMALLASINFLGVKTLATTNSALTWWKVAVPLLTILIVAFNGVHTSNFHAADGFNPYGLKGILLAIPVSGIIFSYLGFEQADQLAGESKNPNRDIPFAVIGSIIIGLVVYIGLQLVFLLALPSNAIGSKWCDGSGDPGCLAAGANGTASLYGAFTGPWAQLAALVSLGWLAKVLYFDAVVSPLGTGLIYTAAGSRVSYGLARNNYFHNVFGKLNARKVPAMGVIVTFIVGCICFLPFPSWQSLVGLITAASVLMYAGAPLSLGAFRKRLPDANRPYRLPGAAVISPASFVVASWIIMWSGWETNWKLGVLIVLGCLIIFNRDMDREHMNPRSAVWLPVYLVGMGTITYFSTFSGRVSQTHTLGGTSGLSPVIWALVVSAVFALGIYYWAVNVSLSAETMNRMINEVVVPEEEGLEALGH